MSVPGNINTAPPPSSFDEDAEFYEESRWAKLRRRLVEEPLIPLGCALTCWALYEATRSMRSGDKYRTNRMFRRRIYAQGFTLLAMVAGSAYWESDRAKRKEYQGLVDDKKKKEKHEAWLKELEVREEEEQELRKMRDEIMKRRPGEPKQDASGDKRSAETLQRQSGAKSALEVMESRRAHPILDAARELWRKR